MSVLIFRLNSVDFDEAEEVRELLCENQLEFYETSAGRWGLSVAGIWLKDTSQLETAKSLLAEYAQQRQIRVRDQHQKDERLGLQKTLLQRVKAAPLQYLLVAFSLAAIIYLSLWPYLTLGSS